MFRFTFGGSDTTWVDDNTYWTRHIEVVTLNTVFIVELEGPCTWPFEISSVK